LLAKEKIRAVLAAEISNPGKTPDTYAIVLAGGNGTRMEDFVYQVYGCRHPKQYVAFTGKRSMIQHTLDRVEMLIPRGKILVVVDSKHRDIIDVQLKERPPETVIFQPHNRETAPGVLLPLASIYKNDPESMVVIFPADHFILEEERFMEHVRFARRAVQLFPDKIALLGIQPDTPEIEYGWIQPGERVPGLNGIEISRVERFHEKPDSAAAGEFFKQGYLWNTLVMVARCSTLWNLALEALPGMRDHFKKILNAFGTSREQEVVRQEYQNMGKATISHSVLEKYPSRLLIARVNDVFWSDWGNGPRVLETLKKIGRLHTDERTFARLQEKWIVA
jgi:mannose-1-phosphate guanylyltransferase